MSTASMMLGRRGAVTARGAGRALFVIHFKRMFIPLAALVVLVYGATMLTTYTARSFGARSMGSDTGLAINLILLFVAGAMALPAGTAAFSRPFKEQQILFFHSLPLSRVRQWLILTGGSFAAVVASLGIMAVLRPAAAMYLVRTGTWPQFAAFVVVSFAAGACFALVFVHPVAVYASAYLGTLGMAGLAARTLLAPFSATLSVDELRNGRFPTPESDAPIWAIGVLVVVFAAGLLVLSLRFYMRGELTILRSQLRNLAIVVAAALLFAFIITPLTLMAFTAAARRTFRGQVITSPDGRYAAATYASERIPWPSEQRIIDLKSGRTIRTIKSGVDSIWRFGESGKAIEISRAVPRLRYGYRDTRVSLYSADGSLLDTTHFRGEDVEDVGISDMPTFATTDGLTGRIVQWNGGAVRELVRAPIDGHLSVARGLIIFHNRDLPPHAWRVHDGIATELPFVKAATKDSPAVVVVNGVAYASEETAIRRIEHEVPLPPGDRKTLTWHLRPPGYETRFVYVSMDRSLYRLDADAKKWERIGDDIPLVFSGLQRRRTRADVDVDFDSTAVAYITEDSRGALTLHVYDGASGRTIDGGQFPRQTDPVSVGWKGPLLGFWTHSIESSAQWKVISQYWFRNGRLLQLTGPRSRNSHWFQVTSDGSQVNLQYPWTLVVTNPNGTTRRIPL